MNRQIGAPAGVCQGQGYHTEHKPQDKTALALLGEVKHIQAFCDLGGGVFVRGRLISL